MPCASILLNIVRISCDNALAAAQQVWRGKSPLDKRNARKMLYGLIGDPGEPSLAVYMPKPNSYTGEDIVELHCHGGNVAVRRTLEAVLSQKNVRSAEPGEFTKRAFLNGKMDLTKAEAVMELIGAKSADAAKAAGISVPSGGAKKKGGRTRRS